MIEKLKSIGLRTIVRIITLIVLLVNLILVQLGVQAELFDFNATFDMLYSSISTILTTIMALWTAWKDNDITKKAITNKEVINSIENATSKVHGDQ